MIVSHDVSENEALPISSEVRMRREMRARTHASPPRAREKSLERCSNAIPEDVNLSSLPKDILEKCESMELAIS